MLLMWTILVAWFVVGLVGLILGAHWFVRGAASLAEALKISPLIIGLTVVAFGTSAPELAVTVGSAIKGNAELAVGNVVGSNIANVLLILGISALAAPLVVRRRLIREDVPIMIGACILLWGLSLDGFVSTLDGLILSACLFIYLGWLVRQARREPTIIPDEFAKEVADAAGEVPTTPESVWMQILFILLGLVFLVAGSDRLVYSASEMAAELGVSKTLIGLTIVAIGTSLPEIATSVVASLKGQRDIAVGNVVGSNIFNVFCVMGISALVTPGVFPVEEKTIWFDMPVMIVVALACLPIFFTAMMIRRWEGALFLVYYVAYLMYLILDATHSSFSRTYGQALIFFAVPLTAVTLVVLAGREMLVVRRAELKTQNPPIDVNE